LLEQNEPEQRGPQPPQRPGRPQEQQRDGRPQNSGVGPWPHESCDVKQHPDQAGEAWADRVPDASTAITRDTAAACATGVKPRKAGVVKTFGKKQVRFSEDGVVFHEMFTPYSSIYGEHPSHFFFDSDGNMIPSCESPRDGPDLSMVDVGVILECTTMCGVDYRKEPKLTARFRDLRSLPFGERIRVEDRSGRWVRDAVGWLPLFINQMPVFEMVASPRTTKQKRNSISLVAPRCGVVITETNL